MSRSTQDAPQAWFALTVHPKHEQTAQQGLGLRGFETYLPAQTMRRRWSDRIKLVDAILFPGYIFCQFCFEQRLAVLNAPGVRGVVTSGKSPLPVDDSEIEALRALVATGRPLLPTPYVEIGQNVTIRSGPLASLRGVVVREKDAWRIVVSVQALNSSVTIEVDRDQVAPVSVFGAAMAPVPRRLS